MAVQISGFRLFLWASKHLTLPLRPALGICAAILNSFAFFSPLLPSCLTFLSGHFARAAHVALVADEDRVHRLWRVALRARVKGAAAPRDARGRKIARTRTTGHARARTLARTPAPPRARTSLRDDGRDPWKLGGVRVRVTVYIVSEQLE
eukprot:912279-Pleurochrysis_carterae.AAC.1